MPKKGKAKRKAVEKLETSEADAVANVNKQTDILVSKQKKQKVTRSCGLQALLGPNDQDETDAEQPKIEKKGRSRSLNAEENQLNETATVCANFVENGRMISMTVQNAEMEADPEQDMNEANRDFVQLDAEESEDGEIDFPGSQGASRSNERNPEIETVSTARLTNRERIRQIDAEMKQRIEELHKLMNDGGLTESAQLLGKCLPPRTAEQNADQSGECINSNENAICRSSANRSLNFGNCNQVPEETSQLMRQRSLETIYDTAVPKQNRNSSSSEEDFNNTSDESGRPDIGFVPFVVDDRDGGGQQVANMRATGRPNNQNARNDRFHFTRPITRYPDEPLPSTSRGGTASNQNRVRGEQPVMLSVDEKADKIIRAAETSKARIFATPGKDDNLASLCDDGTPFSWHQRFNSASAFIDEQFVTVGAHLDENIISKINSGEYVDFSKLLPRDRVLMEDDGRLELVIKNGRTFWAPVNSGVVINNFSKWEQAFRVFSNIYCKNNPSRSAELIEYNHVIHVISAQFIWENVYMYDKDFRLHMARNPALSWAIILQQSWSLRLRDRLSSHGSAQFFNSNSNNRVKVNEPCRRFNRGKCNFGTNCKYEHKCNYCNKFGHGAVNCRKAAADRNNGNNGRSAPGNNGNGNGPNMGKQGAGGSNGDYVKPVQASN